MMNLLLRKSRDEQIPIEIIYLSDSNHFTQRKIIVKRYDDDSITAFCLLRRQIRNFKHHNILSLMPIKSRNLTIS
jgi:hypothetical protein